VILKQYQHLLCIDRKAEALTALSLPHFTQLLPSQQQKVHPFFSPKVHPTVYVYHNVLPLDPYKVETWALGWGV
jgi:hypothetical protein